MGNLGKVDPRRKIRLELNGYPFWRWDLRPLKDAGGVVCELDSVLFFCLFVFLVGMFFLAELFWFCWRV